MKTTFKSILLLLAVAYAGHSLAQNKAARLDSLFNSLYAGGTFRGNVLIAQDGRPVYQRSFGWADSARQMPNAPETRFLLASVSKQFTAMGIVLLKEAGKLSLDDSLAKFLPGLPYPGITIRQLLNHTSGIPDYEPVFGQYWDKTKFATNADLLRLLVQYHPPAIFAPGEKYRYSNTGYALLALVIERVQGMPFADYMEAKVFKPFGLSHTLVYTRYARPHQITNLAMGYMYADSLKRFVLPESDPKVKSTLWEDGIYGEDGINTTVADLLHWDQLVYSRAIISPNDWQQILTAGTPATGSSDYGFGWHLANLPATGRMAFHTGGFTGFIAYNEQGLDSNYTIIMLRNRFVPNPQLKETANAVRRIMFGK